MDPDLTIVLLGNTGVGKSSSGNSILGRRVFEANSNFKAVTRETSRETGRIDGRQIVVVDTPGILGSEQQIRAICEKVLRSSTPCVFLVVLRLGQFSEEDQEAVEAAINILGQDGLRKSFLLFTRGDALIHRWLDDVIHTEGDESLQAVVTRFEGRLHVFNNQHGGREQVRELLEKSDHLHSSASADVPDVPSRLEKRRIVLLGQPGGGKSSAGNTILGSGRFRIGCDFVLVSRECVSESAEVEGRQVTVVDTPGLTEDVLTPEELYKEIMRSIVKASPGSHALVIVVKLGNVSEADKKMYKMLSQLFGSDASKYCMVLFTGGDGLRGHSVDQLIESNQQVSDLVSMCGGRYCVFYNNQRDPERNRLQVRRFLGTVDQMVDQRSENGGEHFTSEMFKRNYRLLQNQRLLVLLMFAAIAGVIGGEISGVNSVMLSAAVAGVIGGMKAGVKGGVKGVVVGAAVNVVIGGDNVVMVGAAVAGVIGGVIGAVKGGVKAGVKGGVNGAMVGAAVNVVIGGDNVVMVGAAVSVVIGLVYLKFTREPK